MRAIGRRQTRAGVIGAVVLALAAAGPAAAGQPALEAFVDSASEVIDCGSYTASLERHFEGMVAVFLDRQGSPLRVQIAARMDGLLTSSTGREIDLRGDLLIVIDLVGGTFTFDGQVFMANVPGSGAVIQDTGKFLVDALDNVLLEAGPHDAIDSGGAIFCTALQ